MNPPCLSQSLTFSGIILGTGIEHGGNDWRGSASNLHMSFIILNAVNIILAVFLLFGPDETMANGRSAVLGFLMLLNAAVGFYACYTNFKAPLQAFFVSTLFICMSLLGMQPLFGFSASVYTTSQSQCFAYFLPQSGADGDYNRCEDNGYLQLVRTFSMFALFFLLMQMFQAFLTLAPQTITGAASSEPLIAETYVAPTYNAAATTPAVPAAQEKPAGTGYQQL
jgi:hypothetical protein